MLQIVSFALKVMATIGGGILGWYVTPPVVRLLVRLAVHKPAPKAIVTVSRLMGALLVAALVWSIWSWGFGDGWGFGPGPGSGPGLGPGGGGTGKQIAATNGTPQETTAPAKDGKKAPPPLPDTLTVRMRGGAGVEKQFYLVDNTPRTLDEVRQVMKKGHDHWKTVEIVIDDESVPDGHPAVRSLQSAARSAGLAVRTSIVEKGGAK
jgi:hypothetical protein